MIYNWTSGQKPWIWFPLIAFQFWMSNHIQLPNSKLPIFWTRHYNEKTFNEISGDRCSLQVAYEHQLTRFPASLTVGPFGGARGRDFLCVQCLDGTLLFYEQEVLAFSRILKARLLPEPLVYIPRNDVFITLGSGWVLECYRWSERQAFILFKSRLLSK